MAVYKLYISGVPEFGFFKNKYDTMKIVRDNECYYYGGHLIYLSHDTNFERLFYDGMDKNDIRSWRCGGIEMFPSDFTIKKVSLIKSHFIDVITMIQQIFCTNI